MSQKQLDHFINYNINHHLCINSYNLNDNEITMEINEISKGNNNDYLTIKSIVNDLLLSKNNFYSKNISLNEKD